MGGLTSLLNKQPSPNGPVSKTPKNLSQWPHFFPKQMPSSYHNSNPICPDAKGKWFDNSTLKIPRNSGFAFAHTNKSQCPNSAIAKSELMKGEELTNPTGQTEYSEDDIETSSSPPVQVSMPRFEDDLKYELFGLFCGHNDNVISHYVDRLMMEKISEKFSDVKSELSRSFRTGKEWVELTHEPFACCQTERILLEEVIMGALEQSFYELDTYIGNNWHSFGLTGGCSVILCVVINEFLYIANAGKCRAYLYSDKNPCTQITADSTPDYDRQRIQSIAYLQPQLLTPEYTRLQFEHTLREEHKGRKVLYRDKHMGGWAFKQVKEEDIDKVPIITGVGNKSRLFGLDIPSRGIGYYGQKAPGCIPFKPFITPIPEITSTSLKDFDKDGATSLSVVLTSPDCSKFLSADLIQNVMSKGYANGKDPRQREHNLSQMQAHNLLSLTNQVAVTNLERQIVNVEHHLLEDSRTSPQDPGLACLVIPLKH